MRPIFYTLGGFWFHVPQCGASALVSALGPSRVTWNAGTITGWAAWASPVITKHRIDETTIPIYPDRKNRM